MPTTRRHEGEDTVWKGRKFCEKEGTWIWITNHNSKCSISPSGLKYFLQVASKRIMRLKRLKRNKIHEVPSQGYRSSKNDGARLLTLKLSTSCTGYRSGVTRPSWTCVESLLWDVLSLITESEHESLSGKLYTKHAFSLIWLLPLLVWISAHISEAPLGRPRM